jgi:hypothetical protein
MNKLFFVFLVFTQIAFPAAWDSANNPTNLGFKIKSYKISELPMVGELQDKTKAWPESHWASNQGSIAFRWSSDRPDTFKYTSPDLAKLKQLTKSEINELSPAEKFDMYLGNYDYPLTKKVLKSTSPTMTAWFGICHGVAPASIYYSEPQMKTVTNKDGISFDFYASDLKALISYYYAKVDYKNGRQIGRRCSANKDNGPCGDVNPASFFIILANRMGIEGKTFIADTDRLNEVWNHVPVNYKTNIYSELPPDRNSARGTIKRLHMDVLINYAAAIRPQFDAVIGTDKSDYLGQIYEFYLDIDAQNNIIGGEWLKDISPDFLWIRDQEELIGDWRILDALFK